MENWDNIIEHRKRREMRLDEKRIMGSSYPVKADYMIKNGIASEKMICCLDNQVLDMLLRNYFRKDGIRVDYEKESKDLDWITVKNGEHVPLDNGKAVGGPLNGRDFSSAVSNKRTGSVKNNPEKKYEIENESTPKISDAMKPLKTYEFSDGMTEDEFFNANIDKLREVYEEKDLEGVVDEYYKTLMENSSDDIREMSEDKAEEIFYDNVRQSDFDGWYRNADSAYKPRLVSAMLGNKETRNAGLSFAYQNYKMSGGNLPFEEFLTTPIEMYRGGHGQKHTEDDVFSAYTFDKKIAEGFAGENGKVTTAKIRPIDTYGSMRCAGNELEIWVPRQIAPNGRSDSLNVRSDADEEENGGSKGKHGNTHIPYGLCEREGIEIGKDWTPRDAWKALEGKGYSASQEYENLKNGLGVGNSKEESEKPATIESIKQSAKNFKDEYKKINEEKQKAIHDYSEKRQAKRNFAFELSAYEVDTEWVKKNNIDEEYIKKIDEEYKELEEKRKSFKDKYRWQWTEEEKKIDDRMHRIAYEKEMWENANDPEVPLKGDKIDKELREAKERCNSIDKKRRELLDGFTKSHADIDIKNVKFYDEPQREKIRNKAITSLISESMPEESKETVRNAIKNASDIHLAVLENTLAGSSIEVDGNCSVSHYNSGTGHITLDESNNDARAIFHEYGHYMDDVDVSGIAYDNTKENGEYEFGTKTFSDAIESSGIEKEAAEDFKELAKRLGSNLEFGYDDENSYMTITENGTGLEINFDFVGNAIRNISYKPIEDLKKKYKVPESPKWGDYFESYRTPKRQKLKTRPKTKTSEEKWRSALQEYNDKMYEISSTTDYDKEMAEAHEEMERIEKSLGGLSDTMCALTLGRCLSVMGAHDAGYYQIGDMRYKEMTANLHQMMFMNDEVAISAFKELMPRTADKLFKMYNDWMWRSV